LGLSTQSATAAAATNSAKQSCEVEVAAPERRDVEQRDERANIGDRS